jgi:hypothetical protein
MGPRLAALKKGRDTVDHDQRFKELLREFLRELLALFLPWLAARLAAKEVQWQSQEVFTNPPLGLVRRVDLLAIVTERLDEDKTAERLLHLEVESATSLTDVRKKIGYYYPGLRTKHNLPVTTLALYLRVGLQGQGWDEYFEEEPAPPDTETAGEALYRVRWRYVGLPALPAERYLAQDNWLGVALSALMKIEPDRKAWLRAEILRRLAIECQENDYRKLLLINCAETYLPLEGAQEAEYLRLIREDTRYQEANRMILTTYDRGRCEALQEVVVQLASPKCGVPSETIKAQLQQVQDETRLRALVAASTTAESWEQLLQTK